MRIRKLLVLTCMFLAALMLCCGCGSGAKDDADGNKDDEQVSESIVVETKNGNLTYSDQWEEFINTEVTEEKDSSEVAFSTEINGKTYKLFEVFINSDESKGEYAGDIHDKDGETKKVYIQMESIEPDDDLSESEMNRLYAMQEDVNYIIDNLE